MPKIDISIIIVNYNVKDFLLQCLRSIENASKNLAVEVIIVDNHSSDGSVEFLKPLFPKVELMALDENVGFARANNFGIERAKGDYVLILNPDTILEEQTLDVMYGYMQSNLEVGIAGCKILNADGTFQLACRRGFPTPWAAFSKLFGLQKLFPRTRLFARYNQTFRSTDETYYIDSVMGAFMFVRKEALNDIGGFDPVFFMYGEDIDLCYRMNQAGWKTAYVHTTSIIHYKGESTRRSSINEVKHFYEAMEIFARKHYSRSSLFMLLLRIGIFLRAILAYGNKHKREIFIIFTDILAINFSLILGTRIRFGEFFDFPPYAYPTVFIAVTITLFGSMLAVGEYFEAKHSIRKSFFGLMVSFFILSSLTYFFKEYAFSRGILLMTIGFTTIISSIIRISLSLFDKTKGKGADRRIALVGLNSRTENIIESLELSEARNTNIIGVISVGEQHIGNFNNLPVLGNIEYLSRIISDYRLQEIIITDTTLSGGDIMKIISEVSNPSVRFHVAREYEEVLIARIINEIAGVEPTVPHFNIFKLRNRIVKRIVDVTVSIFLLTIGIPLLYLLAKDFQKFIKNLKNVLFGTYSLIGLYSNGDDFPKGAKKGIIGLAHISSPERLSNQAVKNLNNYYLQNYSISLDIDIFLKFIKRNNSGNKNSS